MTCPNCDSTGRVVTVAADMAGTDWPANEEPCPDCACIDCGGAIDQHDDGRCPPPDTDGDPFRPRPLDPAHADLERAKALLAALAAASSDRLDAVDGDRLYRARWHLAHALGEATGPAPAS